MLVVVGEAVGAGEDGVLADGEDYWEAVLFDFIDEGAEGGVAEFGVALVQVVEMVAGPFADGFLKVFFVC